jgi:hypothetical protein
MRLEEDMKLFEPRSATWGDSSFLIMSTAPMPVNCLMLLRRFADGSDQDAFAEIVQGQAGWMRGTALRMTGDDASISQAKSPGASATNHPG